MKPTDLARKHLDHKLEPVRGMLALLTPPSTGWLRAIRHALGMSSAQLADRMGISQSGVVRLELSEKRGTISVNTLRKAAEALDCTVVYALVPNKALESVVFDRANDIAARLLARVNHSMLLESQGVDEDVLREELRGLRAELLAGNPSRLWNEL